MPSVKELLRDLQLGNSVAEFDSQLESYFVETQPFDELKNDNRDIVSGDKGTGKTAIFRILHKKFESLPELRGVMVIPAFNVTGNPIFQQLTDKSALEEGEYVRLWKAFILSLVGNWLINRSGPIKSARLTQLDHLLRGLELRSDNDAPANVFQRVIAKVGHFFRWKSAEMQFAVGVDGKLSFTPKVQFGGTDEAPKENVSVEAAIKLLNACLGDAKKIAWVAIDRLDEAFQGFPDIEVPALRALFRTYLDLLEYDKIKPKLFVRRDLFRRIVSGGFVNLTHVNARKTEIIWDEEDLLNLLCSRVRQNTTFCGAVGISKKTTDQQVFDILFPEKVDAAERKPKTWTWMMGRIRDGNDVKPPRNLIDLVSMARDAQLRKEDREPREYQAGRPLIEADALRRALVQLSEQRVNDTLLAEAKNQAPMVEKFRRGKSEHNSKSLSEMLGVFEPDVRPTIKPLIEIGFLEEIGNSFKIPMIYRGGLEITQGKAF